MSFFTFISILEKVFVF